MPKTNKLRDWLTPKVCREQEEDLVERDIEGVRLALNKIIAQKAKAKAHADNKGKFGKYRYYEGIIAGLTITCAIISERFADEH